MKRLALAAAALALAGCGGGEEGDADPTADSDAELRRGLIAACDSGDEPNRLEGVELVGRASKEDVRLTFMGSSSQSACAVALHPGADGKFVAAVQATNPRVQLADLRRHCVRVPGNPDVGPDSAVRDLRTGETVDYAEFLTERKEIRKALNGDLERGQVPVDERGCERPRVVEPPPTG